MNQDDDVERLFSWLQTPEIRYREFAGAREVTDATVIWRPRTNTAETKPATPSSSKIDEEYPPNQFPDQSNLEFRVEPPHGPQIVAPKDAPSVYQEPTPAGRNPEPAAPAEAGPFALGPSGRPGVRPADEQLPTTPSPAGGLLGGAYQDGDNDTSSSAQAPAPAQPPAAPSVTPTNQQAHSARSLDSVFNRIAGGRPSAPDPRDRLRHIPGLGPTGGRQR